jgi:hypothetical protein
MDKALVASSAAVEEEEQQADEWDLALVTSEEKVFFTQHDILLDNEASINKFQNRDHLTGVRESDKTVLLGGIQRGAAEVRVTKEGDFRDIGKVYYEESLLRIYYLLPHR